MINRIIISNECILYEISRENGNVKGGFDYTQRRVITIEEAEEVLNSLNISEEFLNE